MTHTWKNIRQRFICLFLFLCVPQAYATAVVSSSANPSGAKITLGDASNNVLDILSGLNGLAWTASYVVGTGLIASSVIQYRAHRNNPSQVRLYQPIVLLLCGLVLVGLPFLVGISTGGTILENHIPVNP